MNTNHATKVDKPPHRGTGVLFANSAASFCTWVFLLRVPLVIAFFSCLLPLCVVCGAGPCQMVRGAYDATPFSFGILVLTLAVLAFSLHMVTHLVLSCGNFRYRVNGLSRDALQFWDGALMLGYLLFILGTNIAACVVASKAAVTAWYGWLAYLACGAPGLFVAFALLGFAIKACMKKEGAPSNAPQRMVASVHGSHAEASPRGWLHVLITEKYPRWFGDGFGWTQKADGGVEREIAVDDTPVTYKHLMVARMGVAAWAVYVLVGYVFWHLWHYFKLGQTCEVSAIIYVLMLFLAATWTLSSLSFLLDRYRIPLFSTLAIWVFITGRMPTSDYTFTTVNAAPLPTAADILGAKDFPIVVSAEGGGIHSGSWAVEVLTQLEEMARNKDLSPPFGVTAPPREDRSFSRQIRAVSGVSGGSYGLMFFADAYEKGEIPKGGKFIDDIKSNVQRPSLGPAVRNLVYADLWHLMLPFWNTEGRSRQMEKVWIENTHLQPQDGKPAPSLSDWGEDARNGIRPVVLFNSTGVESGRPVVFGSSRVSDWNFQGRKWVGHDPESPQLTVPVSTGARLSAAFPLVSPAARPRTVADGQPTEHHVDGGYYDNFGIVTLTQWLQEGLRVLKRKADDNNPKPQELKSDLKRLLVIQIRYKETEADEKKRVQSGTLFQTAAPLVALYNVRTTGQKMRNNEEFDTFSRFWSQMPEGQQVQIVNAVFEFDEEAALSWHLTREDKDKLTQHGARIGSEYATFNAAVKAIKPLGGNPTKEERRAYEDAWKMIEQASPLGANAYQVMKFLWETP